MKRKRIHLDKLEDIARLQCRKALEGHTIPEEWMSNLDLLVTWEGDRTVFQLYVPADNPLDAKVIARVRVDSYTGEASPVEVFPPGLALPQAPALAKSEPAR